MTSEGDRRPLLLQFRSVPQPKPQSSSEREHRPWSGLVRHRHSFSEESLTEGRWQSWRGDDTTRLAQQRQVILRRMHYPVVAILRPNTEPSQQTKLAHKIKFQKRTFPACDRHEQRKRRWWWLLLYGNGFTLSWRAQVVRFVFADSHSCTKAFLKSLLGQNTTGPTNKGEKTHYRRLLQ